MATGGFEDAAQGGFFESPPGDPSIRVRMKDGFDGAEIAGNSLAAHAVQLLGALLGRRDWLELAGRAFGYYRVRLAGNAWAMPRMLVAMDLAAGPVRHVVVAGDPEAADTRALIHEYERRFLPRDLLLVVDGAERSRGSRISRPLPRLSPGRVGGLRRTCAWTIPAVCP